MVKYVLVKDEKIGSTTEPVKLLSLRDPITSNNAEHFYPNMQSLYGIPFGYSLLTAPQGTIYYNKPSVPYKYAQMNEPTVDNNPLEYKSPYTVPYLSPLQPIRQTVLPTVRVSKYVSPTTMFNYLKDKITYYPLTFGFPLIPSTVYNQQQFNSNIRFESERLKYSFFMSPCIKNWHCTVSKLWQASNTLISIKGLTCPYLRQHCVTDRAFKIYFTTPKARYLASTTGSLLNGLHSLGSDTVTTVSEYDMNNNATETGVFTQTKIGEIEKKICEKAFVFEQERLKSNNVYTTGERTELFDLLGYLTEFDKEKASVLVELIKTKKNVVTNNEPNVVTELDALLSKN